MTTVVGVPVAIVAKLVAKVTTDVSVTGVERIVSSPRPERPAQRPEFKVTTLLRSINFFWNCCHIHFLAQITDSHVGVYYINFKTPLLVLYKLLFIFPLYFVDLPFLWSTDNQTRTTCNFKFF